MIGLAAEKPRFDRLASGSVSVIQDLEHLRRRAHAIVAELDRLAERAAQTADRYGEYATGGLFIQFKATEGAAELRSALGDLDTDITDAYARNYTEEFGE